MQPVTTNKPNIKQAVPFFMVTNMEESMRFYIEGLDFKMLNSWTPRGKIEWCWLQRDGVALMLQEYREGKVPAEKLGVGVSINFTCEDALAIYHETLARNLKPSEPFVGNNMWVVMFRDPDGYKVEFESVTDIPEETTFSEWTAKKETI